MPSLYSTVRSSFRTEFQPDASRRPLLESTFLGLGGSFSLLFQQFVLICTVFFIVLYSDHLFASLLLSPDCKFSFSWFHHLMERIILAM